MLRICAKKYIIKLILKLMPTVKSCFELNENKWLSASR